MALDLTALRARVTTSPERGAEFMAVDPKVLAAVLDRLEAAERAEADLARLREDIVEAVIGVQGVFGPNVVYRSDVLAALRAALAKESGR